MQLSVTITSTGGQIVIQDPHPVSGVFAKTVPAGGSKTFICDWPTWHRIAPKIEAYRAAGACTVALSEVTPTGTDSTSGANTTYNRSDWALLNSFRKDIGVLQAAIAAMPSPFIYKGSIAVNTSFPLVAAVQTGWTYTISADVTDNAGATYTNTGLTFYAGEEITWDGSTWTRIGSTLTAPFQYKGVIANAAAFPAPAATLTTGVRDGHVYRCTAAVIDNDPTKTNTSQEFLLGDLIVWYSGVWYVLASNNTLIDGGAITLAADFPSPTAVKRGYCYRILADVIDNGGATKTNTGQVFSAGDQIMWDGISAWVITSAHSKMIYKGTIATSAGFPLIALVKIGYAYTVTAAVVDNAGAIYTNTGLAFREGDVIVWNGSTWSNLGNNITFQFAVATPVVPTGIDSVNIVDTVTIAAPSAVALPAAVAASVGRSITIADGTGGGAGNNIVVTPNGTDTIDGVNAPITLDSRYEFVTLQCVATGAWLTIASNARVVAGTSDGLMTSAQATMLAGHDVSIAAIVDDHVYMQVTGLDMKTDEIEISGALNGAAGKRFLATHILVKSSLNVGAVNSDGTINIGTAADGAQIAAGVVLTGVAAVDTARMIPIAAHAVPVAGNATLYVNVESAETGAGTLEIDVTVVGRQI